MTKPKPGTRIESNPITRLELEKFTTFDKLAMDFSPGLNVIIGANSTGKTHVLKVIYSLCRALGETEGGVWDKLDGNFLPHSGYMGSLVHKGKAKAAKIRLSIKDQEFVIDVFRDKEEHGSIAINADEFMGAKHRQTVYIPSKDMLVHAPGLRSLFATRDLQFELLYADLLDEVYLPRLKQLTAAQNALLDKVEGVIGGTIEVRGEYFFLKDKKGELEFSLLSEGFRKFALLWILIRNGSLSPGSVLLWDEPETNLNPKLQGTIVEVLMELQRAGVQVFIATHNYVLLKEIHLRMKRDKKGKITDKVMFHSLYWEDKVLQVASTNDYLQITPNVIQDTFMDLYDRDVKRAMGVE